MEEMYLPTTYQQPATREVSAQFKSTEIAARSGIRIAAEVASPTSNPKGVVIFVHGFCGNKDENGLFRAIANRSVARGFHAVMYDWRGIGQSDGNFPFSTLEDHVSDFEDVLEWTRSRFEDCPGVRCAVGFSLGAAIIGLALKQNSHLDCVAYLSPAVRPNRSMWPRYKQVWRTVQKNGPVLKPGGSVLLGKPILESLRKTDLGSNAFDVKIPLLVCHGTDDTRIDNRHTQDLVRALGRSSDFQYEEFLGASHSFRPNDKYWDRLASLVSSWFDKTTIENARC